VEPYEKSFPGTYRVDGLLREVMTPPQRLQPAITSSHQKCFPRWTLPRSGCLRTAASGSRPRSKVACASSTSRLVLPTVHGEKVVLRLLDKENLRLDMTKLGFENPR